MKSKLKLLQIMGTGEVNRVTYLLVLAEAFVLSYDILFIPKNIFCQVNDYISEGLKNHLN